MLKPFSYKHLSLFFNKYKKITNHLVKIDKNIDK